MSRILVTGASGFVGSKLVERLGRASPHSVVLGVGRPASGTAVPLDILDREAVRQVVRAFKPTAVVHLAGASSIIDSTQTPERAWAANFDGVRNLAAALREMGSPVRFIFASSGDVYGAAFLDGPCTETTAPKPRSTYARTKLAAEYVLSDWANDQLTIVALRLFNHTGEGQDTRFVVPGFAAQIAAIEKSGSAGELRVGNLDAERDFTDIEDIIDAYVAVLEGPAPSASMSVFNVGSGQVRSIRSIVDGLLAHSNASIDTVVDPTRLRPTEIPVASGVFSAFQQAYGWRATRDLDRTLAAVLVEQRRRTASASADG